MLPKRISCREIDFKCWIETPLSLPAYSPACGPRWIFRRVDLIPTAPSEHEWWYQIEYCPTKRPSAPLLVIIEPWRPNGLFQWLIRVPSVDKYYFHKNLVDIDTKPYCNGLYFSAVANFFARFASVSVINNLLGSESGEYIDPGLSPSKRTAVLRRNLINHDSRLDQPPVDGSYNPTATVTTAGTINFQPLTIAACCSPGFMGSKFLGRLI